MIILLLYCIVCEWITESNCECIYSISLCTFQWTLTFDARRILFDFHSCRIEFLCSPFVRSNTLCSSFFGYRQ